MSHNSKTINSILEALNNFNNRKTSAYDTIAQVRRVEDNIAWIHIPGGIDETPAKLTVSAKAGDTVQVRISNGRAWITGNVTAPPTDDTKAEQAMKSVGAIKKVVSTVRDLAEKTAKIAGNTNQYFWHTESGTDTGAHITEIPKDDFLEDPTNGGGNLLARSNGIAVRDGLTELGTFAADGIAFNNDNGTNVFEIVTEETQTVVEKGILDTTLTSGSTSGSYQRKLTYQADVIQYIQVSYMYNFGVSGGIGTASLSLTPSSPSTTKNHLTAQYTESNNRISLSFTHDGTSGTLYIHEILVSYTTTLDGISKVRSGTYPKRNNFNIFEVGNGTSSSSKSNAISVDIFGNISPVMDFAMLTAESQVITQAVNEEVKANRVIANGDCFEAYISYEGYNMIKVKKKGYYQILVSSLWSAVGDATKLRVVSACSSLGVQYGTANTMGKDNTYEKRIGFDIVFIEANQYIAMWARDEGGTGTLRIGQIIVHPVWLD